MSQTALITGATGGIGAVFARRFARDGYDLILTGRRKEIIQNLGDELAKEYNIKVNVVMAELSDDDDFQKVSDVVKACRDIVILINNAGYSGYARHFQEVDIYEHEKMVKVHNIVPMRLISLTLPGMINRGKGAITNLASIGAFLFLPSSSVYCATKAFLKMYSESLYLEVKDKGIKVQALCPGVTKTDFAQGYYPKEMIDQLMKSNISPDKVVDISLKSLKKNRLVCIPKFSNKMLVSVFPHIPISWYSSLVTRMTPWK